MNQNEDGAPEENKERTHPEDIPIVADGSNGPPAQAIGHPQAGSEEDDPNKHKWGDKWMVRLTAALVFCAAVSAVLGYYQWKSIDGQLQEMKEGGNQVERQLMLAGGQLTVATRSARSQQIAAEAAQKSVKAIQRQMRQDQRAWIKIEMPEIPRVVEGEDISTNMTITNIGKTAARDLKTEVFILLRKRDYIPAISYAEGIPRTMSVMGALFPNQPFPIPAQFQKLAKAPNVFEYPPLSKAGMADWESGVFYVQVYARTRYKDVFNVHHWTLYCATFVGTKTAINIPTGGCAEYNNMDNN